MILHHGTIKGLGYRQITCTECGASETLPPDQDHHCVGSGSPSQMTFVDSWLSDKFDAGHCGG